jgi:DUF971 family protein
MPADEQEALAGAEPVEVCAGRERREVAIRWRDGHESVYSFDLLRRECPCALCVDQRAQRQAPGALTLMSGPVLRPGDVRLVNVSAVGRYAINFVWSDGHDAGIYTYAYLRGLCPCPGCKGAGSI